MKNGDIQRKLLLIFTSLFLLFSISISSLERLETKLMPTFMAMCEIQVKQVVNICIDNVITMLQNTYSYKSTDFYTVVYDKNGNVSLIENNSILINKLTNDISYSLEDTLRELGDIKLEINILDVLFPEAFDNIGPNYKMHILNEGFTDISYKSEIKEIGGNQTNFKAYIKINVNVKILSPLYSEKIQINRDVLLIDTIISSKNVGLKIN